MWKSFWQSVWETLCNLCSIFAFLKCNERPADLTHLREAEEGLNRNLQEVKRLRKVRSQFAGDKAVQEWLDKYIETRYPGMSHPQTESTPQFRRSETYIRLQDLKSDSREDLSIDETSPPPRGKSSWEIDYKKLKKTSKQTRSQSKKQRVQDDIDGPRLPPQDQVDSHGQS